MARGCHGRFRRAENKKKKLKETAKDRRTWRELAEKAKSHKGAVVPNGDDDNSCI